MAWTLSPGVYKLLSRGLQGGAKGSVEKFRDKINQFQILIENKVCFPNNLIMKLITIQLRNFIESQMY